MSLQTLTRALACTLTAFALAVNGMQPARPAAPSTLRVGFWTLWHDRELALAPAGRLVARSCQRCPALSLDRTAKVRAEGNSVALVSGNSTVHSAGLWLSGPVTLSAHGESETIRNPVSLAAHSGVLSIAVTLPVESYVERVVASESGPADTLESLKALAIIVRSFALHEPHGHADYDLCDSTHCQLLHWHGNPGRSAAAHAATLATTGETLWFQGQRALAYFHKDCGGRSAAVGEVWPRATPVSYLASHADKFCAAAGPREWASDITRAELASALAARGLVHSGWQVLSIGRRGESGRAVTMRLDATEISAEDFRIAVGQSLGWNRIPSTWFEVTRQGDSFLFHGRGWGHGVGLCQKGSAAMASLGLSAGQILAEYFPAAQAADEATGRPWQGFKGNGFTLQSLDSADAAYLPDLTRARAEASQLSGLNAPVAFTVRAFASTPAFRNATLAPGWVAAFTEGQWIAIQPLRTLASRKLLAATMRHEFLHALVEREAGPHTPLWLREGLVEAWGENALAGSAPTLAIGSLDAALAHPATEAESAAAHRAAKYYAARLLARFGRDQVVYWLRSGLPAGVVASIGQR